MNGERTADRSGRHRARGFEAQQREAMMGCTVLNKMLALGKAQSSAVTV